MDSLDVPPLRPPPPPPKDKPPRPKITLQIPEATSPVTARGMTTSTPFHFPTRNYKGRAPMTPASHVSDPQNPYFNPFVHMYHNKASEFMFKQFEGFKDFTMNTAKSGLSAGEKSAFWFVNKLKILSKKWFTHFFLTICLVVYSIMGAAMFMALEGSNEKLEHSKYNRTITEVRREAAARLLVISTEFNSKNSAIELMSRMETVLEQYEANYTDHKANVTAQNKKTWTFWNAMFYAGTIYTTIVAVALKKVMTEEGNEAENRLTLLIPKITAESETQTTGQLVSKSPEVVKYDNMDNDEKQTISIRKRRNLSKNRGQAARQREKTPEPGRTPIPHEDTTTSDDEEAKPPHQRTSRELEAEHSYLEVKRLVQEKAGVKDPVYDIDTEEILEARAFAAHERRRRSISPFAVPDKEELSKLERKGSFIDPTNKLLSTSYTLSPKDEDSSRRNSLTIEPPKEIKNTLSSSTPTSASPIEKGFPYPLPTTPKKLTEIVYDDEQQPEETPKPAAKTPEKKENVFTFEEKENKQNLKPSPKTPETPSTAGELVTKVIQVERTPSKKLTPDKKPTVEVRERIVRTPSRKMSADVKPVLIKQPPKQVKEETQTRAPPVKPARSKSASRFGSKTSESEMSEDQGNQLTNNAAAQKRRVQPTPRRFAKNRSPRANRSQSVNRFDETKVIDKTGTGMSETSKEIIELMQKARARSLSIPKDDPRLPSAYKNSSKTMHTPSKTLSTPRNVRGISCPKTIQIISDKEILCGLPTNQRVGLEQGKRSRQSSGYVDASQSEYTSSCYSTSPSENEYEFDLSERTAELTRKLKLLSEEVERVETKSNIILSKSIDQAFKEPQVDQKPKLRKRSIIKPEFQKQNGEQSPEAKIEKPDNDNKKEKAIKSRWRIRACWQEFKEEHKAECAKIRSLRNRCICDLLILIILCGLGGMMFKSFEGSFENTFKCGSRSVKRDFIEALWRGSHYLREDDWKSLARNKLHEFENQLHTAFEAGVTSYSGQRSWNFMNSFVYCLTLITTIGYGHIAPKTTYGRAATIVYAVIGIPLFLIVLADFGKLFTRIIKFFWAYIRRFYYTRSCRKVRRTGPVQEVMKGLNIVYDVVRRPSQIFNEEDIEGVESLPPPINRKTSDVPPPLPPKPGSAIILDVDNETEPETPAPSVFEIDDEFNLPISVAIVILIIYIFIGAVIYNTWENWTFFESFYFVFISMSTIGLGDLVPDHPHRMMASIMYLVFGLALTSMCINVVQVKLNDTFKQASAKLGATIGLKVAEEDGSLVPITPPPIEIVPVHKPRTEIEQTNIEDKTTIEDTKVKQVDENESDEKEIRSHL